ncbi:amidase family protein [Guptibacillus spartinae]|uniref:amidase family protein n=1 Tax=Guptibacillus spartinae TaxID=3025679 RepID=UPI00236130B5|nr:amidase family protein [Pseudalkalibacillus spartinae]
MLSIDWLERSTILDLQQAMLAQKFTSKQLVQFYLNQIADHNHKVNAILEINPEAVMIAESLDRERQIKGIRSSLHGIPILLKDNINTGDHMHTSAGSQALATSYGKDDAFLVKKLRHAGAVILGKTNMTEWANFMSDKMPNGYSSRGGQVLNPYGPRTLDVGGSSSGSAVAIACHFATAAIGTETNGSILSPSSSNGGVGLKPTVGTISRSGIIPISFSQDTAGPMTRNVTDAAILLSHLTGEDPMDPATHSTPLQKDYTPYLLPMLYEPLRIGIVQKGYYDTMHMEEQEKLDKASEDLKEMGCTMINIDQICSDQEQLEEDYQVLRYEFKSGINRYLAKETSASFRDLQSIINYYQQNPLTLPYGQSVLLEANETSGSLTEAQYLHSRVRDISQAKEKGLDLLMETEKLDALLFVGSYGSTLPAKAGYPSITVPGGFTSNKKPLGLTFTGKAFSEPQLIKLAYAFEQHTRQRILPEWLDNHQTTQQSQP